MKWSEKWTKNEVRTLKTFWFIYLSICLSVSLSVCLPVFLSVCLSIRDKKNGWIKAIVSNTEWKTNISNTVLWRQKSCIWEFLLKHYWNRKSCYHLIYVILCQWYKEEYMGQPDFPVKERINIYSQHIRQLEYQHYQRPCGDRISALSTSLWIT